MLVTNIRIEPASERPSPLQAVVNASTAVLNGASMGVDLFAPYRAMLVLYAFNRAATRAMFNM